MQQRLLALLSAVAASGVLTAGCASERGGASAPDRTCTVTTAARSTSPSSEDVLVGRIEGSGPCRGVVGSLTVTNAADGPCSSDIVADIGPGIARMGFMNQTFGNADGTWRALPRNTVDVTGGLTFPTGEHSVPIELPRLDPGTYTFRLASGVSCPGVTSPTRLDVTFAVA